jgi:hypothetical protein
MSASASLKAGIGHHEARARRKLLVRLSHYIDPCGCGVMGMVCSAEKSSKARARRRTPAGQPAGKGH